MNSPSEGSEPGLEFSSKASFIVGPTLKLVGMHPADLSPSDVRRMRRQYLSDMMARSGAKSDIGDRAAGVGSVMLGVYKGCVLLLPSGKILVCRS